MAALARFRDYNLLTMYLACLKSNLDIVASNWW